QTQRTTTITPCEPPSAGTKGGSDEGFAGSAVETSNPAPARRLARLARLGLEVADCRGCCVTRLVEAGLRREGDDAHVRPVAGTVPRLHGHVVLRVTIQNNIEGIRVDTNVCPWFTGHARA